MKNKIKHANACTGDVVWITTGEIIADKCEVVHTFLQFPKKVVVKSLITGNQYSVFCISRVALL